MDVQASTRASRTMHWTATTTTENGWPIAVVDIPCDLSRVFPVGNLACSNSNALNPETDRFRHVFDGVETKQKEISRALAPTTLEGATATPRIFSYGWHRSPSQ